MDPLIEYSLDLNFVDQDYKKLDKVLGSPFKPIHRKPLLPRLLLNLDVKNPPPVYKAFGSLFVPG
jgi:hypothetical protein